MYRPQGGNADGSDDIEITAADMAGPSRITYKVRLQVIRSAQKDGRTAELVRAETPVGIVTRSYQIAHGTGGPITPPAPTPSISTFESTSGNLSPAVGSIANNVYGYRYAIGQSGHAGAVRIVGFKGAFDASSVTVLANIDSADFAHGSGVVNIPAGVSLADGETYTLRLQAFAQGTTNPGASTAPAAYQDIVIRAHATATAAYHWGRIIVDSDDANAAATAARIVFANNDLVTGDALAASYAATPPDAGTDLYQFYLAVEDGETEPVGWNSGGLIADAAFQAPVTRTISGTDFKFWILQPDLARLSADGSINYEPRT